MTDCPTCFGPHEPEFHEARIGLIAWHKSRLLRTLEPMPVIKGKRVMLSMDTIGVQLPKRVVDPANPLRYAPTKPKVAVKLPAKPKESRTSGGQHGASPWNKVESLTSDVIFAGYREGKTNIQIAKGLGLSSSVISKRLHAEMRRDTSGTLRATFDGMLMCACGRPKQAYVVKCGRCNDLRDTHNRPVAPLVNGRRLWQRNFELTVESIIERQQKGMSLRKIAEEFKCSIGLVERRILTARLNGAVLPNLRKCHCGRTKNASKPECWPCGRETAKRNHVREKPGPKKGHKFLHRKPRGAREVEEAV